MLQAFFYKKMLNSQMPEKSHDVHKYNLSLEVFISKMVRKIGSLSNTVGDIYPMVYLL